MKKWWLSLVLLLVSGAALATSVPGIDAPAVDGHTDLSVSYLAQIFGTVGNTLIGTSGQMLGHLMGPFNLGIMTLTGVWLIGTIFMTTVRFATEGSFMSQNNKVPLIFLRVALGMICLIPNPSTGYSLLQDTLMSITVEGVSLGDQVWSYGLNYLYDGGQLWVVPTDNQNTSSGDESDSTANLLSNDTVQGTGSSDGVLGSTQVSTPNSGISGTSGLSQLGLAQRIFASEVCMVSSSMAREQQINQSSLSQTDTTNVTVNTSTAGTPYEWHEDDTYNTIFFPGGNDDPTATSYTAQGCGYVAWDGVPGTQPDGANPTQACHMRGESSAGSGAHCEFARLAIVGMVNDLMPTAKEYACAQSTDSTLTTCAGYTPDPTQLPSDISNALFTATLNYANAITPLANSQLGAANGNAREFIPTAEQLGWISAGRFYWDLMNMESATSKMQLLNTYIPHTVNVQYFTTSGSGSGDIMSPRETSSNTSAYVPYNARQTPTFVSKSVDSFLEQAGTDAGNAISLMNAYAWSSSQGNSTSDTGYHGGTSFGMAFLNVLLPIVGDFTKLVKIFQNSPTGGGGMGYNPIVFMHNLGMICIDLAGDIWFAPIGSLFAVLICMEICTSEFDMGGAVDQVLGWIKPFFMALAMSFATIGAVLALFIPLQPLLAWILIVVGWMTQVLMLMVGAPIMALGITNSQGHDIWGRSEHAIFMVVSVFLEPSIKVIGLIAYLIFSFVTFKLLIWGFSGISFDLFSQGFSGYLGVGDVSQGAARAVHVMENQSFNQNMGPFVATGKTDPVIAAGGVLEVANLLPAATQALTQLMIMPLFLMVFAYTAYEINNACLKLISSLSNIIKYVGSQAEQSAMDSAMQAIQGGLAGGAGKLSQASQANGGIGSLVKPVDGGGDGVGASSGGAGGAGGAAAGGAGGGAGSAASSVAVLAV